MNAGKTFLIACLIPACTGLSNTAPDGEMPGGEVGTGGNGGGDASEVEPLTLSARYALSNTLSITTASVAPEPAYELLSDLNDDPGHLLVNLADAAGVPAAALLFDSLPDSLSGRVEQWMTDAVSDEGLAEIQLLMEWSRLVLANVELQSTLEIGSLDEELRATATHTLNSFTFDVAGVLIEEDVPQIDSLPGAGHSEVLVHASRDTEGLHLRLQEQRFGVLFGEVAYRAFESQVESHYGTNLRGVLGSSIDCVAVAQDVSERCVVGVCVGHEAALQGVCEGALDTVVEKVREQFSALDAELLLLESGEAVVEPTANGSKLVGGAWQAQAELGQGLRSLPASFVGESF